MGIGELVSILEDIIRMQSEIIDAYFLESLQHKQISELEGDKAFQLINDVAEKRRKVDM